MRTVRHCLIVSHALKCVPRIGLMAVLMCAGSAVHVEAQVQLKNNLLYDVSLTPNVNVEFPLAGPHWSADIGYGLNPWTFDDNKKLRHWLLQPELRRWFCQRWDGSFVALHLMGGEFNAGGVKLPLGLAPCLHHNRYEGWYVGGGIGYGYQWPVSRHFSMEAEVAVGYDYLKYRKYPCEHCGTKLDDGHYHYIGPTKIALNVIYNINNGSRTREATLADSYGDVVSYSLQNRAVAQQAADASTPILGGRAAISNAMLATAGQQMVLSMAVHLDSLRLRHAQRVVLRPVLRSTDGTDSVRFRPLMVNSRDMHVLHLRGEHNKSYPDAIETMRHADREQTVSYLAQVPYQPWMDSYNLEIEEDLCGCGDPIADNTTPLLTYQPPRNPYDLVWLTAAEPAADKPSQELSGSAYITFVVNRWELKPDYMNNPRELRKITDTLDIMVADKNVTVERIKIHGYASPESPYDHNSMLATNRAKSLTEWVRRKYQLPAGVFAAAEATPENWQGLRTAVEQMTADVLPHRQDILDIIDDPALQPDPREARIKQRYPQEYQQLLRDVYPGLRRSDYEITFKVRQFNTIEECLDIYRTKPNQLSQHELWRVAQTFPEYSDDYNRALQTAYNIYPTSATACLNLANVALHQGDLLKAETLLQQAGESAQAENARAVLCILREQYQEAAAHLENARQKGLDVSRNQEAIRLLAR